MESKISVIIVNWNGEKYLKKCIQSLLDQNYNNIELIIVDNASTDRSVEIIKNNFEKYVKLIINDNIGYAGGANVGIDNSSGDYIMIANPDVVFDENYIKRCIQVFESNDSIAAVTGKLLKYDFDKDEIINHIDSAGIAINHKRNAWDRGQNDADVGQFEKTERVFGVCGAAAIFRTSSLEDIKVNNEYFDNDFFAYKEDIDICWRLNLYGYVCMYIHDAIAYHGRGMNSSKGIINTIKNRRSQSLFLKGISFRNQYLMLIKNETEQSFKKDKINIYMGVLKYLVFFLFFDYKCFKYISEIKKYKGKMLDKRKVIQSKIKLNEDEIYNLFELDSRRIGCE